MNDQTQHQAEEFDPDHWAALARIWAEENGNPARARHCAAMSIRSRAKWVQLNGKWIARPLAKRAKPEPVRHLTYTGKYAGEPWCDISRMQMQERGDSGIHMPYLSREGQKRFADDHVTCEGCVTAFQEDE